VVLSRSIAKPRRPYGSALPTALEYGCDANTVNSLTDQAKRSGSVRETLAP
jgi:hypothetical protein